MSINSCAICDRDVQVKPGPRSRFCGSTCKRVAIVRIKTLTKRIAKHEADRRAAELGPHWIAPEQHRNELAMIDAWIDADRRELSMLLTAASPAASNDGDADDRAASA